MSWARDEWKEGLTAQALRKVSEFEVNLDRNRKELQQRQFQLDSVNAALQKQKILTEEQRNVGNEYKRELQVVSEKCDEYKKTHEKISADIHMKESRIKCLDGLLQKERQALECEVSKCSHLKDDLVANIAKYDKLASEFSKLQKDVQVQQKETNHHEVDSRTFSCPSSSDSEPEKEVFAAYSRKSPCSKPVPQEPEVYCRKLRGSSSSGSEDMGLASHTPSLRTASFQTPSEKGRVKELQRTMESVRKEKDSVTEKWQKSMHKVDALQSQLTAMENKQKQLLQQIECSRHNAEAGRKHQEERMKEKERQYREEISTQTKALVQLEQQLKEATIKLDQKQKSSDVRVKEFEITTKKMQKEIAIAREAVGKVEDEKNEQRKLVESCESTIAELRKGLRTFTETQAVAAKSLAENAKTIENLNLQLQASNVELEDKRRTVAELQKSRQALVAEERAKYMELLKTRQSECSDAGARVKELEECLESSDDSNSEKGDVLRKQIEALTAQVEKTAALLKQKEQQILAFKMSLDEKNRDLENMAALLEKCTNSEELKKISEEKLQSENNLESTRHLCESLKTKLKESEMEVSQMDAQRQVLQMDLEDKDELIKTLQQQKATLNSGFQENVRKIAQLTEDLRAINEETAALRSENEILKSAVEARERSEKQLRDEVSQVRVALEKAIAGNKSLAEELSKTTDDKNKMCEMYEIRTGELERMLNELRSSRDVSEKNALSHLNAELMETQKILDEKTRELDSVIPRFKSLQEDFNLTVVNLEKANVDLETMRTGVNTLASQKSNLVSDLKTTEQQRDDQVKVLAELEAAICEKDGLVSSLRKNNEEILEKRNAELASAELKFRELSDECQEKTRLLTQGSEKVDELCAERDRLTASVERLRAELSEKERERQKCAEQCRDFMSSSAEYKASAERLDGELAVALEQAENQRASFEAKYSELKEQLVLHKDSSQENNNMIEDMKNNLESLKSAEDILSKENDRLKSENSVALQEAEKAGARCEELSERSAHQVALLNEYKFTVEQLEIELASTKEFYESAKTELSEDLAKLKGELNSEKENLNAARNDIGEKLFCISSLTVENECLQIELENAKSEMQEISEKLGSISTENDRDDEFEALREKLETQEASLQEYRQWKEEHEELQRDYDRATARLEKSKETLASLQDSLKESALEKEKLCHELRKNVDTYEALVSSINEEKTALEKAAGSYRNTIEEIQDQLDSQIRRTERTEYFLKQKDEELFVANKELDSKLIDVQRLEKAREESKEVEVELRRHLGVVTQELEVYKAKGDQSEELVEANEKIRELEETMTAKSSKLEEEREEIVTKTKEFVLQLEKEYTQKTDHLEDELTKKEQILSCVREENCQLSHQLEVELKSKKILLIEIEERENEMELEKKTIGNTLSTPGRLKALEADLEEENKLTKRLQEKCADLGELTLQEQKNRVEFQKKVKSLQEELLNAREKNEKIVSLESDLEVLSQKFGSVKCELESEKVNNLILDKEVGQLKQRGLELEKRLQSESVKNEMLRIDYEQLKERGRDSERKESQVMVTTNEQPDSMKVCELECFIDSLKKEIAEQQGKIVLREDSLKRALDDKNILEQSLDEELKRKQELLEEIKEEGEARGEKINVLEMQVEIVSQKFASVTSELDAEKANKIAFGKEIEELNEKGVNLETRLGEETAKVWELQRCVDALKKELAEQQEQPDSVNVGELECCIDSLKKEVTEQQEKIALGEESLKRALEDKNILEQSLHEELKHKQELVEKIKEEASESKSREAKVSAFETQVEIVSQQFASVKAELEAERANKVAFGKEIEQLNDKRVNLEERLREETAKVCELQRCVDALKNELTEQREQVRLGEESVKRALVNNDTMDEKLKQKDEFLEKKKEEILETQAKCSSWREKCTAFEKKLDEDQRKFELERKAMGEKNTSLSACFNDAKRKFADSEEENKSMMDRLLQLEGEMIMMPRIEDLQTDLERLKKELNDEKENAAKYEKLSQGYLNKLNELTSVNNRVPSLAPKLVTKDTKIDDRVPKESRMPDESPRGQPSKDEQKEKGAQSRESTPVMICEEKPLMMSPITRSLSKLGFSSPAVQEKSDSKKPSGLLKQTVTRQVHKSNIKAPSNLPEDRKRKDVNKDKVQSNAKRMKCDSSSELQGVRSPFILNRNRGIQTRSKTTSHQSRLPQPSSRIPQSKARTRIPKQTTASETNAAGTKGSLKLPTTERSSEECKMQ